MSKWSLRVALVVFTLVLSTVFLPPPYVQYVEFDLRSGQLREVHQILGIRIGTASRTSMFGDFAKRHLPPVGPAQWVRAGHNRTGQLVSDLGEILVCMEVEEAPLDAQITLAQAALAAGARDGHTRFRWVEGTGVRLIDDRGAVLAEWSRPTPTGSK